MIPFWGVEAGRGAAVTSALRCQLPFYFDLVGQERREKLSSLGIWDEAPAVSVLGLWGSSWSLQRTGGVRVGILVPSLGIVSNTWVWEAAS